MKWSLFNWKKPVVSSGEPEDYQVVKNTVSQNERNITNINSQITNVNNQLNNTVTVNTNQTITGQKTINAQTTISANPTPLILKANNNDKTYLVFRDNQNNSNFSLGANADGTSFEMNRGHLTIKTLQDNKNVAFERVSRLKLNQTVLEAGTEINAGYGGGTVKFIPEDNSTKTLQFFNSSATDQRRFKLAVPEPVDNNNPATKNYVDTKNTEATTYTDNKITETRNYIDTQISGINMVNSISYQVILVDGQSANSTKTNFGPFVKDTIEVRTGQNVKILSITAQLDSNLGGKMEFTYSTYSTYRGAWLNFMYEGNTSDNTNWQFSTVTIWYVSSASSRIVDPFYIVQRGVNNEN